MKHKMGKAYMLVFVLFLFSFNMQDRNPDEPYDMEIEDIVYPGKHMLTFYPSAVSLVYRYSDTLIPGLLHKKNIYAYKDYMKQRADTNRIELPINLLCEKSPIYYLNADTVDELMEFFNQNNIYIYGFYFHKNHEANLLTRTITIKIKEGKRYQPVIDSLYSKYPLKFRGKIMGMPYHFNWEANVYSSEELIGLAQNIKDEEYVESVNIHVYPCVESDFTE